MQEVGGSSPPSSTSRNPCYGGGFVLRCSSCAPVLRHTRLRTVLRVTIPDVVERVEAGDHVGRGAVDEAHAPVEADEARPQSGDEPRNTHAQHRQPRDGF